MKSSYQNRKEEIAELKKENARLLVIEKSFRDYLRADFNGREDIKRQARNAFLNHCSNPYYAEEIKKEY